ncbi:MAG: TetR/AcrR family transcriptional regulator, partial [Sandaracinaceae bacterium]|nr:TetR/AcrR family transcriptional regulator [Sandaracinaceae bacterium]
KKGQLKSKTTPREEGAKRGVDKRERILRAAIRVFAKKGFYAARVSEIAKTARVADGTIYLYFRNKEEILISLFESRIELLNQALRAIVEEKLPFEERFFKMLETQFGAFEGQPDLAEVVTVNLRQSTTFLKQYAAPRFTEYLDIMASLVSDGQKQGVVRNDISPRFVARALWGALDGLILTWTLSGGDAHQLRRIAKPLGALFLDGLRLSARASEQSNQGGDPSRS